MRKTKKILSLLLAALMVFGLFAVPALAATQNTASSFTVKEEISHKFYQIVDKLIFVLGKVLNTLIPGLNWAGKIPALRNYSPENFYPGKNTFDGTPAEGAKWKMGFAAASFLTDIDPMDGSYYMVGTLEALHGRVPTEVLDDQGVNTFALSDGTTTAVFASIDGYGLTRGDVLEIRSRLADFAEANQIDSINVSALHQHSLIDTLGLGAPLVPAILKNPLMTLVNEDKLVAGKNKVFMEALYSAVTATVMEAVENMTEGALYYGSVDVGEYIRDKRDPQVFDPDFQRLRFVPDDESANEIWVAETGIHCVSLGAGPTELTADFPHYIEQYVKETYGADFVFFEGSELAISSRFDSIAYDEAGGEKARLQAIGVTLGEKLAGIENETALAPLLNLALREVRIKVENPIHTLAGREGLLGSVFLRDGLGYTLVTELGYMELGGKLGVALVPGEIEPAILWGGATEAADSWQGKSWDYAPWAETCGAEKLICFGLCNDQIGYILCENDFRSMLTENEEINAVSPASGTILTQAFEALIGEVK